VRQIIQTEGAPKAIGPYSQAVLVDGWLYASGQIPLDPGTGTLVPGGVAEQTRRVLENLTAVLGEAGGGLGDVVKTTVYLKDLGTFAEMNAVYGEFFGETPPARATVEVARLPMDVLVEIDCVAKVA
jgi:2-iminobutanoate/2-iminopropanoate deaminase